MIIAIGSTNRVKVEALSEVIQGYPEIAHASVIAQNVSSGISDQPLSLEEMIQGAKNRARNAFAASGACKYAFGIESGVFPAPGTETGFLEATICAIYDGEIFRTGLSCGFEVPLAVLDLVLSQKHDLNDACFKAGISSDPKLGSAQGIIGLLSKGRIDRKSYTKQAIMTALIQLENPSLYATKS